MNETALMQTAFSPLPDNIDTASVLSIKEGCLVCDAYVLITDRKNIKKVLVSGTEYTSQQVRSMVLNEPLGKGGLTRSPVFAVEDTDPRQPAPQAPALTTLDEPEPEPAIRPIWNVNWGNTRRTLQVDPAYQHAIEALMRDNPNNFREFGDTVATEQPNQTFQHPEELPEIFDGYTGGDAQAIW